MRTMNTKLKTESSNVESSLRGRGQLVVVKPFRVHPYNEATVRNDPSVKTDKYTCSSSSFELFKWPLKFSSPDPICTAKECPSPVNNVSYAMKATGSGLNFRAPAKTYDVIGCLKSIDKLNVRLGLIGDIMPQLIANAASLKTSNKDPIEVFNEPENVVLFQLIIERLLECDYDCAMQDIIDHARHILECAERNKKTSDIDNLARAMYGKDADEITKFISRFLKYSGKVVTSKKLQDLYSSVSAKLFEMALSNNPSTLTDDQKVGDDNKLDVTCNDKHISDVDDAKHLSEMIDSVFPKSETIRTVKPVSLKPLETLLSLLPSDKQLETYNLNIPVKKSLNTDIVDIDSDSSDTSRISTPEHVDIEKFQCANTVPNIKAQETSSELSLCSSVQKTPPPVPSDLANTNTECQVMTNGRPVEGESVDKKKEEERIERQEEIDLDLEDMVELMKNFNQLVPEEQIAFKAYLDKFYSERPALYQIFCKHMESKL